jgi:enoyl-CoA hydratase
MSKPVIGAINGAAVTGGLELALYCDILIASEQARFADTHARVGLLPTWGLSVRLPQKVGIGMARRMSLTGDYLSAADALRAGLVTEVVPHEQLMPAARGVAASIVGNNQKAVRALLDSYHRIDEDVTGSGLWMEAESARAWMRSATGDDIAASRASVMERGRAQARH